MIPPHLRPYLVQGTLPVALLASLFNIGWMHVFLAFPMIIHFAIFFRVMAASEDVLDRCPLLGALDAANIAAMYVLHAFLPDAREAPDSLRCCFGQVTDPMLVARAGSWARWAALLGVGGILVQAVWVGLVRTRDRRPARPVRPPFVLPAGTPPIRPASPGKTWHWP